MKLDFDKHRDVWGPIFIGELQAWGKRVYQTALVLIENGQLPLAEEGIFPASRIVDRKSDLISLNGITLDLLAEEPANYSLLKHFDFAAEEYEMGVHPFKEPITQEVFKLIASLIDPRARILDCSSGPGYETIKLAEMVPQGEVIATDLSKRMISLACHNSKQRKLKNVGFFQRDAHQLDPAWNGMFDLVFCQLSCGYYDDMKLVAKAHFDALGANGRVVLVEPNANMANGMSIDTHKAANPSFNRMYDYQELRERYRAVGFNEFYWKEILPGMGVSIMGKTQ